MTKDKIRLFIDSSVYVGAGFNFVTGSLLSVKEYCEAGIVQLLINDIVINEVEAHIKNDIGATIANANSKLKSTWTLNGLRQANKLELLNESKLIEFSLEQWQDFIVSCKAQKLEFQTINIVGILNDYFNGIPPFEHKKDKKSEFPDAITIDGIKALAKTVNGNMVVVISKDKIWEKAFSQIKNVCCFDDIGKALDYISLTTNVIKYKEIKNILPSYYPEIELWLNQILIKEQRLFMDFEFEDIEEVYFRKLRFHGFEIESIHDENAFCTVGCSADTVVDYDNFVFSNTEGYRYYSHDGYRELHRLDILINIYLLYKEGKWFIEKKSIVNSPTICENTKLKDLPFWCAECEERLYSENETDGEKCKECALGQETLM